MATIREENCSLSRTSRHLAVVTASGAQKYKLSLQRHSMLSFDTEEEELNIATRADTMMTLSPPSSCSITNGSVCSSHIQWANRQRHYALHKLPLLLRTAPPSETFLKAPEEKETTSEKHKNNPLVTPEVTLHIKSVYQNIPHNVPPTNINFRLTIFTSPTSGGSLWSISGGSRNSKREFQVCMSIIIWIHG